MTPPILFLVADCLRADRAFGQARLAPDGFIGRISAEGRSFTQAVTVTPTTTPAVATMLTGCYPFEHGLRGLSGFSLPRDVPTVAAALRSEGYRTEAVVTGPLQPELRLFEDFDDFEHVDRRRVTMHGPHGERLQRRVGELQALGRPWFLLWHLWDLHEPRQVPRGFAGPACGRTVYDRALGALDQRLAALLPRELLDGIVVVFVGDHGENLRLEPRGKLGKATAGLLWWKPSRRLAQTAAKAAIARGARSRSKRLLRLAPRAFITHGHHLFEPLIRVPYIVSGPGIRAGAFDGLVTHTDLAPTIASFAQAWFAGGMDSRPLPLEDEAGDPHRRVLLETAWVTSVPGVRQVGVRTPRWKYMEVEGGTAPALFDLEADPLERRNVIDSEATVAAELREDLAAAHASARLGDRMSQDAEDAVTRRLADLGYLN